MGKDRLKKLRWLIWEHVSKPGVNFKVRLLGRASKCNIVLDTRGNSIKKACLPSLTKIEIGYMVSSSLELPFCTSLLAA